MNEFPINIKQLIRPDTKFKDFCKELLYEGFPDISEEVPDKRELLQSLIRLREATERKKKKEIEDAIEIIESQYHSVLGHMKLNIERLVGKIFVEEYPWKNKAFENILRSESKLKSYFKPTTEEEF